MIELFMNEIAKPKMAREGDFSKDGILYCGTCKKPRQAWIDWIPDKDGNTDKKLVPIMCDCDVEAERIEKDRKAQQDYDEAMRHIRLTFHTMRDDVRWTFDKDDSSDSPIAKTCRKYVERFDEMKSENMGILFYGSKGTGKSFYASCIYNALIARRVLVGFTSTANLMNLLKQWDQGELFDAITRVKLLVLDDLGAERNNTYSAELMYSVIDARYKTNLPTIVTTNIDIAEMKNEQDIWRSRIYDRVIEMCPIPLSMEGQSRRGIIADQRKQKARELLR